MFLTFVRSRDEESISPFLCDRSLAKETILSCFKRDIYREAHFETIQLFSECPETYMACSIGLHVVQMTKQMGPELQHHRNVILR